MITSISNQKLPECGSARGSSFLRGWWGSADGALSSFLNHYGGADKSESGPDSELVQ